MTEHVQAVVVGGGIVGCSVLYALARLGWTDTLLIERRNLTSGSTWHAAGNVTYFGLYPSLTRLYVSTVNAYLQAESESGQDIGFHPAGSLRIATTPDELEYYENLKPLYERLQVEFRVISPEKVSELFPLFLTDNMVGAAHTPADGHVDSSGTTYALAKAATQRGSSIRTHCRVVGLDRIQNGNWRVETEHGDIFCEHIVIATSFWAREMLEKVGLKLPIYALEHHAIITDKVEALQGVAHELPTVRDRFVPCNIRQEGDGLLCGIYEFDPVPWAVDGIPDEFAEDLLGVDTKRLEPHMEKLVKRIPVFEQLGIKTIINGPICYTPDGLPLLGPVENLPGLWLATGYSIGIGTGGGSGDFLANWMVNGSPQYDLSPVYPSRFAQSLTVKQSIDQIVKTYGSTYAILDQ